MLPTHLPAVLLTCLIPLACADLVLADAAIESLLSRTRAAESSDDREAILVELSSLKQPLLESFVQHAMKSDEDVRLFGAFAFPHFTSRALARNAFDNLKDDPAESVKEVAWLSQSLVGLDEPDRQLALQSTNPLIRSAGVLRSISKKELLASLSDLSPLVRSCAIRRIGLIYKEWGSIDDELLDGVAAALHDGHATVRSDALAAATAMSVFSSPTPTALLLDDRAFLPLEDVLGPEQESSEARKLLAIDREYFPTVSLLAQLQFRNTVWLMPPRGYRPAVIPPDQDLLIGTVAAMLYLHTDRAAANEALESVLQRAGQQQSTLRAQLESNRW